MCSNVISQIKRKLHPEAFFLQLFLSHPCWQVTNLNRKSFSVDRYPCRLIWKWKCSSVSVICGTLNPAQSNPIRHLRCERYEDTIWSNIFASKQQISIRIVVDNFHNGARLWCDKASSNVYILQQPDFTTPGNTENVWSIVKCLAVL